MEGLSPFHFNVHVTRLTVRLLNWRGISNTTASWFTFTWTSSYLLKFCIFCNVPWVSCSERLPTGWKANNIIGSVFNFLWQNTLTVGIDRFKFSIPTEFSCCCNIFWLTFWTRPSTNWFMEAPVSDLKQTAVFTGICKKIVDYLCRAALSDPALASERTTPSAASLGHITVNVNSNESNILVCIIMLLNFVLLLGNKYIRLHRGLFIYRKICLDSTEWPTIKRDLSNSS